MSYASKKVHEGKRYSGMKVGGIHQWTYPDGHWHERKVLPNRWEFTFSSHKNRKARAPRGSGAGVGSAYHWYITAHQWVEKLDANRYATLMEGSKHLLGFRKPDWERWNTEFRNQKSSRQRLIRALESVLEELREADDVEAMMENPWDLPMFETFDVPQFEVAREIVPDAVLTR